MRSLLTAMLVLCASVALAASASTAAAAGSQSSEEQALRAAVQRLGAGPPSDHHLADILTVASLRDALSPDVLAAALAPVARKWAKTLDRIAPAPEALRRLLRELDADRDPSKPRPWLRLPGAVTEWAWLGPLRHGGGTAFDRADPRVDGALSRQEPVAGRDGPARWRAVPPTVRGRLRFADLVERPAAAIVHAEAWIHVPTSGRYRLSIAASGRVRAHLDGTLLVASAPPAAAIAPSRPLAQAHLRAVTLPAGWHVLRLKLQDDAGTLAVDVRLGDATGTPVTARQQHRPASIAQKAREHEQIDASAALRKAAGRGDRRALLALAGMLSHRWRLDAPSEAAGLLEKGKEQVQVGLAWAGSAIEVGDVIGRLRQLPVSVDPARVIAEAAAWIDLGQPARAHAVHQAPSSGAALASERSIRACAQRTDLWLQLGADQAALAQARRCARRWPGAPLALETMARVMVARDHLAEALRAQQRMFGLYRGSARRFLELLQARCQLGLPAANELASVRRSLALSPQHQRGWQILARAYLQAGDAARAVEALERMPSWQWRSTTHALLGKAHGALGHREQAIAGFRAALRLAPGREDYRAELRDLAPADRFFQPYARDLLKLARAAAPAAEPLETAWAQTVMRHDGSRLARYEAEVLVVGPGGPSKHAVEIDYVPSQSSVSVLQAAVIKPDGRVVRRARRQINTISEDWYGLYYDLERVTLRFSELAPGDRIIVQHVVRDFAADPFGMVFGELELLGDQRPIRALEIVLELPAAVPLHSVAWDPRLRRPLPEQMRAIGPVKAGNLALQSWRLRRANQPSIAVEAGMPGATEVVPYLHMSSFPNAAAVGGWYAHLVQQALQGSQEDAGLRELARSLRGADDRATVANVYRYVADQVRYVGLEFGIHGLLPHDATEVLQRRFGDCKDKATLIVALLQHLGIDAQVALVRTADNGQISDPVSSLGVFDHAIAWIPGQRLWLDATQRDHLGAELPALDAGGMALRIPTRPNHPAVTVVPLPRGTASANTRTERLRIQLAASGSAQIEGEVALTGLPAAKMRAHLRAAATRQERLQEELSRRWAGVEVQVQVKGVEPTGPASLTFSATAPKVAQPGGPALSIAPLRRPQSLATALSGGRDRRNDLLLPHAMRLRQEVTVAPPAGWEVATAPELARIEDPLLLATAGCVVVADRQDGAVRCESLIEVRVGRVPVAASRRWLELLERADRSLSRRLYFRRRGAQR